MLSFWQSPPGSRWPSCAPSWQAGPARRADEATMSGHQVPPETTASAMQLPACRSHLASPPPSVPYSPVGRLHVGIRSPTRDPVFAGSVVSAVATMAIPAPTPLALITSTVLY